MWLPAAWLCPCIYSLFTPLLMPSRRLGWPVQPAAPNCLLVRLLPTYHVLLATWLPTWQAHALSVVVPVQELIPYLPNNTKAVVQQEWGYIKVGAWAVACLRPLPAARPAVACLRPLPAARPECADPQHGLS